MNKSGIKPQGKITIRWSRDFAYAIGLLTADGCLSKDGRHIDFTSKDKDQISTFKKCLGLTTKISEKHSGSGGIAYHTQFGDILFYKFLVGIGLFPAKSKTLSALEIPGQYFLDFVRGYFDGDGTSFSYYDPIFKNSFRFYIGFTSASPAFIDWFRNKLKVCLNIHGSVSKCGREGKYIQLRFSKKEAFVLATRIYKRSAVPKLKRKYLKIQQSLRIIAGSPGGEIGRHATFRS